MGTFGKYDFEVNGCAAGHPRPPFLNSLVEVADRWTCHIPSEGEDRCVVKVVLRQKDTFRGNPHGRRSHPWHGGQRRPDPEHQAPGEVLEPAKLPEAAAAVKRSRDLKPGTFVEVCCGANSRLSAAADSLRRSEAFRVTEEDDFLSEDTLRECINRVRGPADMVWFSIPCTGGSRW